MCRLIESVVEHFPSRAGSCLTLHRKENQALQAGTQAGLLLRGTSTG